MMSNKMIPVEDQRVECIQDQVVRLQEYQQQLLVSGDFEGSEIIAAVRESFEDELERTQLDIVAELANTDNSILEDWEPEFYTRESYEAKF